MDASQVGGIARAILAAVGGYLVGQGVLDEKTVNEVSGAAAVILAAVWSWWSKRKD